jgi:ABC-type branched-subunit amino acid transport system substrate-binding protein
MQRHPKRGLFSLVVIALFALLAGSLVACSSSSSGGGALKIGYLADFSGPLAEFGPEIQKGVDLAVKEINANGGVNGKPVTVVTGDDKTDATAAVEEARRLVDKEKVSAIVGPLASGVAIAVAESVTGPAGVVTISPSATSPALTDAKDNDFLFRSTTSDAAQGVVLAKLATDAGLSKVGVVYIEGAYGQGLADAFKASFKGDVAEASYKDNQTTYLSELKKAAANGATTLICIGYPTQAQVYVREALENKIFDNFIFVDGTKSEDLVKAIGADKLEGMKGTAPASGPETDSLKAWNAAFQAEYGALPTRPYVREAYDAVVAIALAAEKAKSNDGTKIRDSLRAVANPPGETIIPGLAGVKAGLEAAKAGKDINYEGAATTVNWDANGDVTTGYIGIWEFKGGKIVDLESVPFDLSK